MNLKKGAMTIAEYEQKFIELSEFALSIVANNADRFKKLQDGLHVSIRDRLTTLDIDDFNKWVNMVIKAEQNLKEMKDRDEMFRKRKGQSSSKDVRPKKSFSESGTSGFQPFGFEGRLDRRPFGDASSRPSIGPQHQSRSLPDLDL